MKTNKGLAPIIIVLFVVAILVVGGVSYYAGAKYSFVSKSTTENNITNIPVTSFDASWKTYKNTQHGYSFKYPEKLSLSTSGEIVNLLHSIPFENRNGGCDMMGDTELSKTLNDFSLSFNVFDGNVNPPYVDGDYSSGVLNGKWSYMGAEGCGETNYYFPISGGRTLVVIKGEIQMLSPVVVQEVREKILAVPGVIPYEESKVLLNQILSTFEFSNN